jgi:hypothetical protein
MTEPKKDCTKGECKKEFEGCAPKADKCCPEAEACCPPKKEEKCCGPKHCG